MRGSIYEAETTIPISICNEELKLRRLRWMVLTVATVQTEKISHAMQIITI
jgi:hypothetical protein